ncbi:MAG: HAMP domain-containing histidine kinase [Bacteroidales bacterium]|nr:HAMP domain-containing histidine kinase [Bacteroidales bacterium]
MKTHNIRSLIIFAIICITGIVASQVYWFKKAFDLKEKQFNQTVTIALQNVAETILSYNQIQIPLSSLVNQISSNYYAVMTNSDIDIKTLEFLLKNEFQKKKLNLDFEYGVYNCQSEKMVYGNYISSESQSIPKKIRELPVWKKDNYYFSVFFPNKSIYLTGQLGIWLFTTAVLFLVCIFFGYSLLIILQQKRLSDIQSDFINNMTHEFNTPISSIMVMSQLLRKEEISSNCPKVTEYSGLITKEATRIKDQIDKILQIAIMDKHKAIYSFAIINIHECLYEALNTIEYRVKEQGGQLNISTKAIQNLIYGDSVHLINVFFNLVDNSLKYNINIPEISVSTFNIKQKICIKICDNGIGISTKHQKMLFSKFFRVPTGNVHNVKGFGIGLYYVHKVIHAHKGSIKVKSTPMQGTEFTIVLPIAKSKINV